MSAKEAARYIGCSSSTVLALIRSGQLPAEQKEIPGGYAYVIARSDADRCRAEYKQRLKRDGRGCPRGTRKRKVA